MVRVWGRGWGWRYAQLPLQVPWDSCDTEETGHQVPGPPSTVTSGTIGLCRQACHLLGHRVTEPANREHPWLSALSTSGAELGWRKGSWVRAPSSGCPWGPPPNAEAGRCCRRLPTPEPGQTDTHGRSPVTGSRKGTVSPFKSDSGLHPPLGTCELMASHRVSASPPPPAPAARCPDPGDRAGRHLGADKRRTLRAKVPALGPAHTSASHLSQSPLHTAPVALPGKVSDFLKANPTTGDQGGQIRVISGCPAPSPGLGMRVVAAAACYP